MENHVLYVGTYTSAGGEGIYAFNFDSRTGELAPHSLCRDVAEPSFLIIDSPRRRLYAVNELEEYEGKPGGSVSAFSIRPDGTLSFLNRQASRGAAPCHLSLDQGGHRLMVSNYNGGNLSILPLAEDGTLHPPSAVIQHHGRGHTERQTAPHVHCVLPSPDGKFILAVDLGLDSITAYPLASPATQSAVVTTLEPGSGPRQIAFHPSGRFVYAINELHPTLSVLSYDAVTGTLTPFQSLPLLPPGSEGANYGAHVQLSPDGTHLYASNRGHDSITAWSTNPVDGRCTLVGNFPTQGHFPRHFAIDPAGTFLLAANQRSSSLVVLRIDRASGALVPSGHSVSIPAPVCIQFLQ